LVLVDVHKTRVGRSRCAGYTGEKKSRKALAGEKIGPNMLRAAG